MDKEKLLDYLRGMSHRHRDTGALLREHVDAYLLAVADVEAYVTSIPKTCSDPGLQPMTCTTCRGSRQVEVEGDVHEAYNYIKDCPDCTPEVKGRLNEDG